MSIENKVSYQ